LATEARDLFLPCPVRLWHPPNLLLVDTDAISLGGKRPGQEADKEANNP